MKTLEKKLKTLSPRRRAKIEARAAELIAEEMSLRDLRHAHHLTQKTVAIALGMGQEGVSRLEQRTDLLLSTLRGYVEALGGNLELVAKFPDRPPVVLSGLAEMEGEKERMPATSNTSIQRRQLGAAAKDKRRKPDGAHVWAPTPCQLWRDDPLRCDRHRRDVAIPLNMGGR